MPLTKQEYEQIKWAIITMSYIRLAQPSTEPLITMPDWLRDIDGHMVSKVSVVGLLERYVENVQYVEGKGNDNGNQEGK